MGISLYTSREILRILGVEDFGIYTLVGGIVLLFSILNNAMSSATQRFLNIEIGARNLLKVRKIFSMSINIHTIIALLILILAETVGIWVLNTKLNIPADRMHAANIVYQISIVITLLEVIRVPYHAVVLAYERMLFFAVTGICQSIAKLFVVLSLVWFESFDKLLIYSFLLLLVVVVNNIVFFYYCVKSFASQVNYLFERDNMLFKQLLSFSSWSLLGQAAVLGSTQGVNILLNIFFGVVANAALGVANQVYGALFAFVSNAQVAFNPQVIQRYSNGDKFGHIQLVLQASRFSFFLFAIVCCPILIGTDYVLSVWLSSVPIYADDFVKIILLSALINSLAGPLWMSAYAVGNIKKYQIILSILTFLSLPIGYIFLKIGYNPSIVLIVKLIVELCVFIFRVFYFKLTLDVEKKVLISYITDTLPIFLILIAMAWLSNLIHVDSLGMFLWYSLISTLFVLIVTLLYGVKKQELIIVSNLVKSRVNETV